MKLTTRTHLPWRTGATVLGISALLSLSGCFGGSGGSSGSPDQSIVSCRVENADDPQRKMPPIAKSVSHTEAVELLNSWIANVVNSDYENGEACSGTGIFQSLNQ